MDGSVCNERMFIKHSAECNMVLINMRLNCLNYQENELHFEKF